MTGFQMFSIAIDGITMIVDVALILYIVRRWKK